MPEVMLKMIALILLGVNGFVFNSPSGTAWPHERLMIEGEIRYPRKPCDVLFWSLLGFRDDLAVRNDIDMDAFNETLVRNLNWWMVCASPL